MKYKSPLCSCIICHETKSAMGIFTHFLQSHNPNFKSEWKIKNSFSSANKERKSKLISNMQKKIDEYYLSPKVCCCGIIKNYEVRNNKFCSASCGASHSNRQKGAKSLKTRNKISASLKSNKNKKKRIIKKCNICFSNCTVCGKYMIFKSKKPSRKTCSRVCQIHASVGCRTYTNGRRLNIYYFNKYQKKTVLLESSWELEIAEFLDNNDIEWSRPEPIEWIDDKSINRLYYPDFYLKKLNMYLDPKNPTAMKKQQYKMNIIEKIIPILYGDKEKIKEDVLCLSGRIRTCDVLPRGVPNAET